MIKKISVLLRMVIMLFTWITGGYILNKYEYLIAFGDIDNIVGMIPFALVLINATGVTVLLWIRYTKRLVPAVTVIGLLVILSVALFPTALRGIGG